MSSSRSAVSRVLSPAMLPPCISEWLQIYMIFRYISRGIWMIYKYHVTIHQGSIFVSTPRAVYDLLDGAQWKYSLPGTTSEIACSIVLVCADELSSNLSNYLGYLAHLCSWLSYLLLLDLYLVLSSIVVCGVPIMNHLSHFVWGRVFFLGIQLVRPAMGLKTLDWEFPRNNFVVRC